jgi:two-component system, NarL family, response regulator LiaR
MSADAGPNRIRVLIVEDMTFVRESLRQLLAAQPDLEVIADTEFGEEAIQIVQEQVPNVVLLDLVLESSRINGLDVLKHILANSPTTHVVVLSAHSDESIAFPALQLGAIGYLLKNAHPREIVEAVRDAVLGQYHLSPLLVKKIVTHLIEQRDPNELPEAIKELTPREREILALLLKNKGNADIGAQLTIEVTTVKTHVSNILHKLGLRNRGDLGLWWAQQQPPPKLD